MSTSVIDAFFATLSLDGTLFKKGMKDAENSEKDLEKVVNKTNKKIDKEEKDLAAARKKRKQEQDKADKDREKSVKAVRNEFVALAAAVFAANGIKGFIANTINSAAGLGYLSDNLRMSTQDLTAWQRASERAGGTPEGIISQLKESADTLAQLKSGFGPSASLQNFFRFGGNSEDLKDGNTYLLARSRIISDLFKQDPSKAALVARQIGISDDQFDFVKQGPVDVTASVQAQEKNSAVTRRDSEAAKELRNKWLDLRDGMQATAVKILTALIPSMDKLADGILKVTSVITDNKDVIAGWVERLVDFDWSSLASGAKEFAADIRDIAHEIKGLIDRWDEWTGHAKVQTPGVTKLPAAIRIGKTEDLNKDNAATGKPVPKDTGRPKNETLAKVSEWIDAGLARTLASFGNKDAGEYIRDTTGKDDYNVGPKIAPTVAPAPKLAAIVPAPKPAAIAPAKAPESIKKIGVLDELIDRTRASLFDDKAAARRIRDATGVDSYNVGPKENDPPPVKVKAKVKPDVTHVNKDNSKDAPIVIEKLKAMGWTPEQAAGITASFVQESKLDPDARNPNSGAYGVGQWLDASRIKKFKAVMGKDLVGSSLDDQLKFFQWEVTKGEYKAAGDMMRATKKAEPVARIHSEEYERPGADEANVGRRQRTATQLVAADRAANARAVSNVPAAAATSVTTHKNDNSSVSTTDVTIENINVSTQATDAKGIAAAIRPAIQKYTFATQANTGMR